MNLCENLKKKTPDILLGGYTDQSKEKISAPFEGFRELPKTHPGVLAANVLFCSISFFFFFFKHYFYLFILFIYGCVGSSFLCEGFLQLRQAGATLHRGARASHYHGLSCCGAQVPDAQAQQLWLTGLVAPRHVGSSQTRAQTRVPCIGRQTLNHRATREALFNQFWWSLSKGSLC